jgi:hypothetical protein
MRTNAIADAFTPSAGSLSSLSSRTETRMT